MIIVVVFYQYSAVTKTSLFDQVSSLGIICQVLQIFIKMVENSSRYLFFPKLVGSSILLILVCSIIPVTVCSQANNTKVRCDIVTATFIIIYSI